MNDIKFCGSNFGECERCSNWVAKNNNSDKKLKERGA
jgi:hypothetical protein